MNKRENYIKNNGITLIALVITIIVMLILAGVSLNATIGENGIISKAKDATYTQSRAVLEEFLQEKYIENYDEFDEDESKIVQLQNLPQCQVFFYIPSNEGIGNLRYVVDSEGHALYLIKKSGLPEEIQKQLVGGNAGNGEYSDYASLNDVYGVTSDLRVYYSPTAGSSLIGLTTEELDNDNPNRIIFSNDNQMNTILSDYDKDGDGLISAEEARSVRTLTIDSSNISSVYDIYNLTSLEELRINDLTLRNLDGVQYCNKLYYIYLNNTVIDDYSAVGKMGERLQYLYVYNLDDNELSKICSKEIGIGNYDMPNLQYVAFTGNTSRINNIEYYDYVYENKVTLDSNKSSKTITTIECLNNLTDITKSAIKYLTISNNNIMSLKGLENFSNLYLLRADYNKLQNLKGIENDEKLTVLGVCFNELTELTNFNKQSNLETFACWNNAKLKSLAGLNNCSQLKRIFSYNCALGNGIEVNSGYTSNDSLLALEEKNNLTHIILDNNTNLFWIKYIKNDVNINKISLIGCNNIRDISEIKLIIQNCGVNAKVPPEYSLSLLDDNTEVLDLNGQSLKKYQLSDLANYTKITKLGLANVKIIDEDNSNQEIKDSTVLNSLFENALKPLTKMKYLQLYGLSNLTSISFVSNMNSLKELDIRGCGCTDLSILEIKRNNNTMQLGCLAVSNSGINLSTIPNVVSYASSKPTASWLWRSNSRYGGIVCTNLSVWNTLNGSSITHLYIGAGSSGNGVVDLSKCNSLIYVNIHNSTLQLKLPSSLKSWNSMGAITPIFAANTILDYCDTNSHSSSTNSLMTALLNCTSVKSITINCSSDYNPFYELSRFEGKGLVSFSTRYGQQNMDASSFVIPSSLETLNLFYCDDESNFTPWATQYNVTNMPNSVVSDKGCSLKILNIKNTDLSNTNFLNGLTTLETIDLRGNKILSLSITKSFPRLKTFKLKYNNITSLKDLESLKSLVHLDLANNAIYDYSTYKNEAGETMKYKNLEILRDLNVSAGKGGQLNKLYLDGNSGITDFSLLTDNNLTWNDKSGF